MDREKESEMRSVTEGGEKEKLMTRAEQEPFTRYSSSLRYSERVWVHSEGANGSETVVRMVKMRVRVWSRKRRGRGVGGRRDKLRMGARLPLSCVSWPAVKSSSLPVSTGSPQGAIVPDSEGETGTERVTDSGLNNLAELLMNLSFWRLSVGWYSSHAGLPYTAVLLILLASIRLATSGDWFVFARLIQSKSPQRRETRLASNTTVVKLSPDMPPLPPPVSVCAKKVDHGKFYPCFTEKLYCLLFWGVTIGTNASQRLVCSGDCLSSGEMTLSARRENLSFHFISFFCK